MAELGRGAQGRVYLATQPALADRPVVVKITPLRGREHLTLARLQHTQIVPLYWARDDPAENRRTLCMPYFGTVTLDKVLEALQNKPPCERTGRDLLDILDCAAATAPLPVPGHGPGRQFLAHASYTRAVVWIGACLADALQYAHERGLVHLDLKPSNVLLAADGQPMLLDFHIAQEPIRPEGVMPEWLGGTPAYMSPEQQAALQAMSAGRPIPAAVDGRSDMYALGLLLHRLLGGEGTQGGARRARLEHSNPAVSRGLGDVIRKCLARGPGDRYSDAGQLAADLRRHLADLPLHGVPNRSWIERWQKWRRRRPQALGVIVLFVALGFAAVMAVAHTLQQHAVQARHELNLAETALREGELFFDRHDYARAVDTLERGLGHARRARGGEAMAIALAQRLGPARMELRLAQRREAADGLHTLADRIRLRHASVGGDPAELRKLEQTCRALWESRAKILALATTKGRRDDLDGQIEADLLDMALILASSRVGSAGPGAPEGTRALREALDVLAEAEKGFGPKHALYRQRQAYAEALGLVEVAQRAERDAAREPPGTAWDHYAVGRSLYEARQFAEAAGHFRKAVALAPQGFWPTFYEGLCAAHLQQHVEAIAAFRVCIALAPRTAQAYYNRALSYTDVGQVDAALEDYGRALRYAPELGPAALNRGILRYQRAEYSEALVDLQYALNKGTDPAAVHYNLALVHLARQDRRAALAHLRSALQANGRHHEAHSMYERLQKEP
jgi:tetratricopeptide (TPR) repeat protein